MIYKDLKGKTAIVTGSGKKTGIGYGIAEKLASCGCNVIIADLGKVPSPAEPLKTATSEEMDTIAAELAKTYSVKTLSVGVDVTDNNAIGLMVEKIKGAFDHIDILCNNAGASFGVPNTVLSYDEAAWIKTVDVNLFSVFRLSRAVIPLMLGKPASIVVLNNDASSPKRHFSRSVAICPGQMALTRIPLPPNSLAIVLVSMITPALATA